MVGLVVLCPLLWLSPVSMGKEMEQELEGFDEFWSVYPRRVCKLAAKKMFARALKLTSSVAIIRGAKMYAKEREGKEVEFTKHPATWLNAGGWEYPEEKPTLKLVSQKFYAKFTSPELEAWDRYLRRTTGIDAPKDRNGGWWFDSQWPPEGGQHGPQT